MVVSHRSPQPSEDPPSNRVSRPLSQLVGGLKCHLTTLHPERGLSRALVQHLAAEMPGIDFTLEERPGADAVWVCGYERGGQALIRHLRERHPQAVLAVTAREPVELWSDEVLSAGADSALSWPVDFARLSRVLHRRSLLRRA